MRLAECRIYEKCSDIRPSCYNKANFHWIKPLAITKPCHIWKPNADIWQENVAILEDETSAAISMKRKRDCRQMIAERVSALDGPVWDIESVKAKIKYVCAAPPKDLCPRLCPRPRDVCLFTSLFTIPIQYSALYYRVLE